MVRVTRDYTHAPHSLLPHVLRAKHGSMSRGMWSALGHRELWDE